MDRFQVMLAFTRVVETSSFSAAARDLRIGQPAISKAVAGLETQLGVRLLVRSTRRLTPTDAGLAFYESARRALAEADEAWSAAKGLGTGLDGRLRVCAPVTFTRLVVVPVLGSFVSAHPRLRLDVMMDDRNIDLLEQSIDVALRLGALVDSALTARKLASTDRLVVGSPAYLHSRPPLQKPTDLLDHETIIHSQTTDSEDWRFARDGATTAVQVRSRLALSAAEGVREAVLAGLGLAIVSRWMMAREIQSGAVTVVLKDWRLPPADLWAVFPSGRLPTAKARTFVDWLEGQLANSTSS
jgi:DNA-binding transcriptional LysR family regulator